ncbi:hypothetical protein MLD38_029310 [Melastoma candidum]|uniref:Uncharacterized protein n=1 Tax=Melastoma candidum TaxID=119954 RepID=A0ACB9N3Q5_9MYRT|nr:hypothetical protein MLD38_029310 [Melastoma candidum]
MGSVCAEHHHRLHHPHKPLEIPPRKLQLARKASSAPELRDSVPELSLRKFLPGGGGDDLSDPDSDPYSSDHFRMFEFKVRRCTRSRSHDWTDCPFVHPGEKARRRDPRKYSYSGTVCSEFRRGSCSRGDNCEFAHGVFECWLHPSRYRTEACKDGKNCKRKVCFFAHTPRQLRVLPVEPDDPLPMPDHKYHAEPVSSVLGHTRCCALCHSLNLNNSLSPTSTLLDTSHLSPPLSPSTSLSPPLSPLKNRPLTGLYPDRFITSLDPIELNRGAGRGRISYKDVLDEIMNSLDSIQIKESMGRRRNLPWLNMDNMTDDQPQFVLSPSTLNPSAWRDCRGVNSSMDGNWGHGDVTGSTEPDIGWVDELLM